MAKSKSDGRRAKGETAKTLGDQFREARKQLGISQDGIAAKGGIPQRTISHIERGNGNPTLASLQAYAKSLGKRLSLAD